MANEPHYEGPEVTETDNSCCEKDKNIQKIFIYHLLLKMMIVCNQKPNLSNISCICISRRWLFVNIIFSTVSKENNMAEHHLQECP